MRSPRRTLLPTPLEGPSQTLRPSEVRASGGTPSTSLPRRLSALVGVMVVGLLASSACSLNGLNFREDTSVQIVRPKARAEVQLPVTVEWTVRDFEVTGPTDSDRSGAGYFMLVLDREPMRPGHTINDLLSDDQEGLCQIQGGCSDEILASAGIWLTTDTEVMIGRVPASVSPRAGSEVHVATVVFLDGTGRRDGESAFSVEFTVEGRAS